MAKTLAEAVQATRPPLIPASPTSSLDTKRIQDILKNKGVQFNAPDGTTIGAGDSLFNSFNKAQKIQIQKIMGKLGYKTQGINELKTLLAAWYPTIYDSATNFSQLYTGLSSDLLPSDIGAGDGGGPKVSQYITEKSPALLKQNVDKFLLETIGSTNIKKESRDEIMKTIQKMIDEGVTTTTTKDKTGKAKIIQTVGYSDERAGAVVERVAKELEPEKYQQQRELNFFDFMQRAEQMRGGR
jgi:hypothetical protein